MPNLERFKIKQFLECGHAVYLTPMMYPETVVEAIKFRTGKDSMCTACGSLLNREVWKKVSKIEIMEGPVTNNEVKNKLDEIEIKKNISIALRIALLPQTKNIAEA